MAHLEIRMAEMSRGTSPACRVSAGGGAPLQRIFPLTSPGKKGELSLPFIMTRGEPLVSPKNDDRGSALPGIKISADLLSGSALWQVEADLANFLSICHHKGWTPGPCARLASSLPLSYIPSPETLQTFCSRSKRRVMLLLDLVCAQRPQVPSF